MAPSNYPFYQKDEKVLCFHHELLYEAKVLDHKHIDENDKKSPFQYRVHYKGWKNTWDDWVPQDRIRKNSDENKELAANLKSEMDKLTKPAKATAPSTKKKPAGSDLSSARGSEERQTPVMGRGQKRGRDYDIEKVRESFFLEAASSNAKKARQDLGSRFHVKIVRPRTLTAEKLQDSQKRLLRLLPPRIHRLSRTLPAPDKPLHLNEEVIKMPKDREGHPYIHSARNRYIAKALNGRGAHTAQPEGYTQSDPHPKLFRAQKMFAKEEGENVFFQDAMKGESRMIAGIPLDDTPKDLVQCVKKKRQLVNQSRKAAQKFKFTDREPIDEQESDFNQRPAIHIPVSDHLKSLLVDDWENVTKNRTLIPLPAEQPVNDIVDAYFEEEKRKRHLGSSEAHILEEVVCGIKEYFDKTLGKILLYRFERQQYLEVRQQMDAGQGVWEGKAVGDVYGAEHLARLLVSLPELIAQTNMDEQSVRKLREELTKLTTWLGNNSRKFFTAEYEAQTPEYLEKARGA